MKKARDVAVLTEKSAPATLQRLPRRSGRVAECAGLENRWARKGPVSSNLTSSVSSLPVVPPAESFPRVTAQKLLCPPIGR